MRVWGAVCLAPLAALATGGASSPAGAVGDLVAPRLGIRLSAAAPETRYGGPAPLRRALQSRLARPVSLATADLDEDGAPDIVCGFGGPAGGGILAIHRGDLDSIYPEAPAARARQRQRGGPAPPLRADAALMALPATPTYLQAADLDGDGHADVLAASPGDEVLYFLRGDGVGSLDAALPIALPGPLTALAVGEVDRPDGNLDLVVGVRGRGDEGSRLLVYASPSGALWASPAIVPLSEAATQLALPPPGEAAPWPMLVAAGPSLQIWRELTLVDEVDLPAPVVSMAWGRFDRGAGSEVALLTEIGDLLVASLSRQESPSRLKSAATALQRVKLSGGDEDDLLMFDAATSDLVVAAAPLGDDPTGAPLTRLELPGPLVAVAQVRLSPDALDDLIILHAGPGWLTAALTEPLSTFTVTNTNSSGAGSLRQAITDANAAAGADAIGFNIPGAGPHTILPLSALPAATGPLTIDATTQPGFAGTPVVELVGNQAGASSSGLTMSGGTSVVRGLAINSFGASGIRLRTIGGDIVEGCAIGTNPSGTIARPNGASGVLVENIGSHTIGGLAAQARNVISANTGPGVRVMGTSATSVQVLNNVIGTRRDGAAALGNTQQGIFVDGASGTQIGGSAAARNVVSGNGMEGILIGAGSTGTLVRSNIIGADATGSIPIGNTQEGVRLLAGGHTIGGSVASEGNTIAFNGAAGVAVGSGAGNRIMRNAIFSNTGLGIDLGDNGVTANDPNDVDSGANLLQNHPLVTSAFTTATSLTLSGTLDSRASTSFTLEFFWGPDCDGSGRGEGQEYFTSQAGVLTNASGDAAFSFTHPLPLPVGVAVTATATDPNGNTSEFSPCAIVSDQTPAEVTGEAWSSGTRLDWPVASGATSYRVYRGPGGYLPNLTNSAAESCLRLTPTSPSTGSVLTETPALGNFYWYLVAAVNAFGEGSFGAAALGVRVVDSFGVCPTCAHDKCATGAPLASGCDPCVTAICDASPSCCSTQWTSQCVDSVLTLCGSLSCPQSRGACAHLQCVTGRALAAGCDVPPLADSCVTAICAIDSPCCSIEWDPICVEEVVSECSRVCN